MLFITVKITMLILVYKIVQIGPFSLVASTFVVPLWFILGDLITEVYGYRVAKNAIWGASSIVGEFVFAIVACVIEFAASAPSEAIIELITISLLTKLIFTPLLIIPSMYVVALLKKIENVDSYDCGINYNPFSFQESTGLK